MLNKRISRTVVAATTITLLALAGCSTEKTETTTAQDSTTASTASDSCAPLTIKHAMGETTIDKPVETVVALDRGLLDPAIALDLHVVGYTAISGSNGIPDYFGEDGKEAAKDAVSVGSLSEPSLEKISSLNPDVILSAKVRHEEIYDQLSKIAPTVFAAKTGATWKDNLLLVGEATCKDKEAEQLLKDYEDRAQRIGDRVREKLGKNPTVTVVRFLDEPTRIYKEDTYIGVIMNDLGFDKNEASTGTGFATEISEEQIGLMDADQIFITTYADSDGISEKTKEEFKRNPLWGNLHGQVTEVTDATWMSAVGLYGANSVLDDVAETFGVTAD